MKQFFPQIFERYNMFKIFIKYLRVVNFFVNSVKEP